jgi:hypothetical protein
MTGIRIVEGIETAYALHYYSESSRRQFIPIHEGETIEYNVSTIHPNKFRGYYYDRVEKYLEYFRAIDSHQIPSQYHRDILNRIEKQIRDERRVIR